MQVGLETLHKRAELGNGPRDPLDQRTELNGEVISDHIRSHSLQSV